MSESEQEIRKLYIAAPTNFILHMSPGLFWNTEQDALGSAVLAGLCEL